MARFCSMCNARIDESFLVAEDGCQKLFEEVLAREYSDPVYGEAHKMSVDCYALQHSEIHRPTSNAFHLLRLGWTLYRVKFPALGKTDSDFKKFAYDLRDFPSLETPRTRGKITVVDVSDLSDAHEHLKNVCIWAGSVWKAYRMHHHWVGQKLGIDF